VGLLLVSAAVGILGAVNLYLAARSVALILGGAPAVDWAQYVEAGSRISGRDVYAVTNTYAFHYSPLAAYFFGPLSAVGELGWRIFHIVAALALPTWPMRVLTLASWPFWYDVETGNILVLVVLAGAWALRGSRLAAGAYLLLLLLVPRPLMIPLAVSLLWTKPDLRVPFVIGAIVVGVATLATGWADEWVVAMLAAGDDVTNPSNVAPSRLVGALPWMVVGIPLAAWLTWKGRLGLAGLAASPYWLPYYLLVLVVEVPSRWPRRRPPGSSGSSL
jgi:hypothetical protein